MSKYFFLTCLSFWGLFLSAQKFESTLYDYAKNAPKTGELESIVSYLEKGATTDQELAAIMAYWIMNNIAYDVDAFLTGAYPSTDWETTFYSKKTICSGYANLYSELCRRVGLHTAVISGFAKGFGYKKDTKFERSNHAWNYLEIDGKSFLLDITWASGYVEYQDKKLRFVKFNKPEMLFSPPEVFIERHLPSQHRWQLLNHPVSLEHFMKYASASEMIDSSTGYFNFEDSISSYFSLPKIERKIADAEASALVNPKNTNLPIYYENIAYELSQETSSVEQLRQAKKFYQKARSLYKTDAGQRRCDQGVDFVNFYLTKM